jgi:hypothetical protein
VRSRFQCNYTRSRRDAGTTLRVMTTPSHDDIALALERRRGQRRDDHRQATLQNGTPRQFRRLTRNTSGAFRPPGGVTTPPE